MERPIPGFWQGGSLGWKADDQSFINERSDVLTFSTDVLDNDIEIMGDVRVKLYASTSGSDCDWVVKLIDAYPEKYDSTKENSKYDMSNFQMLVADEVIRAKYRNSFEKPERVQQNKVMDYQIDLLQKSHCFKKGHRILVQVQSSWFPLIDRNPQTFIDIGKAASTDYKRAKQKVFHSATCPSYIELAVTSK
jgi:putative CocE/NonD family hydrolase